MKKLISLSIFTAILFIALNANAQMEQLVTISETYQLPVFGDSIHYVNANTFGFDAAGVGAVTAKVWDFSALMNTGTSVDFIYVNPDTIPANLGKDSFPTATIARRESGAAGYFYYQNTANNINRLGWFSDTNNYGIYKDGTVATEFHFPITAGQNFSSTYNGIYSPFGVGEDSVRITDGTISIAADMQGKMILPTGTFNDVLRIHVIESFHIKTYMFNTVAMDNLVSDDYYYWFADTILQPLFIYGITTVDGTAQTPVLRYQPISTSTGINNNIPIIGNVNIIPNPSNGKFTIAINASLSPLSPWRGAGGEVKIYNVLGEKIYFSEFKPQNEIDLSNYPKGIYFAKLIIPALPAPFFSGFFSGYSSVSRNEEIGEKIYITKIVIQ